MVTEYVELATVATVTMGVSPKGDTYNDTREGLPLLNGPTEFGPSHPQCTVFTTDPVRTCNKGDILLCVRGSTTGRLNWADRAYAIGRGIGSVRGASDTETRFVRYCIEAGMRRLLSTTGRTTFPNLNKDDLERFQIPYPPNRGKVVEVLSAYDDLIENNLRRIAILEEMARAIYQEWFVEFRYPGHDSAALVQSDLGEIPDGWRVCRLSEVASVNELAAKQEDLPSSVVYMDISSVSLGRIDYGRLISRDQIPSRARRVARHGDTVWSSVRPNRGSYGLVLDPPANLIVSTGFVVITPKRVPFSHLYHAVTTDDFVGYLANHATGSAYPAVSFKDFEEACLLVPSVRLLDAFHTLTGDMLNGINVLQRQNGVLGQMRDLLIPKLIAGEVDMESLDGVCARRNGQAIPPDSGGLR